MTPKKKANWICPLCKKRVMIMIPIKKVYRKTHNPKTKKWKTTNLEYEFDLPEGTHCCIPCWDKQMKRNSTERDKIKALEEKWKQQPNISTKTQIQ